MSADSTAWRRKLNSLTGVIYAYYFAGVFFGLTAGDWMYIRVSATFADEYLSTLKHLSMLSAEPAAWMSYFSVMTVLQALFLTPAVITFYRLSKPKSFEAVLVFGTMLGVAFGLLWFLMMAGSGGLLPHASTGGYSGGARLVQFMLSNRVGLALLGSAYMAGALLFATIFAAMPLVLLKTLRTPH